MTSDTETTDEAQDHRATAPRLTTRHLMMWTGVTAVLLALSRCYEHVLGPVSTSGWVIELIYVLPAGPALATLILLPFWRRRGFRFPGHAGDWILLAVGLLFVEDIAVRMVFYFDVSFLGKFDFVLSCVRAVTSISTSICFLLAICFARRAHWRFILLPLLYVEGYVAVFFVSDALGTSFPFADSDPLQQIAVVLRAHNWPMRAAAVLIGAIIDIFRDRKLPWTHWLGIGCYIWYRLVVGVPAIWAVLLP